MRWYLTVVTIIFPDDQWCLASFHVLAGKMYISFGEMSICVLAHLESDCLFLSFLSGRSSFFKKKSILLIYLTALGLRCGTRDLRFSLQQWDLYSQHVGFSPLSRDQTRTPCVGIEES